MFELHRSCMLVKHNLPNTLCICSRAGTKYTYYLWRNRLLHVQQSLPCDKNETFLPHPAFLSANTEHLQNAIHRPSYPPEASNCFLLSSGHLDINMFHQNLELLPQSIEQSLSWEANRFSASQEIPRIFMESEGSLPLLQQPTTCSWP